MFLDRLRLASGLSGLAVVGGSAGPQKKLVCEEASLA
jgi:hypothetical protein